MTKIINGTTNNQYWNYKLEVTEISTDIVNRTSTIKVEHFLGRKSNAGSSYFSGSLTIKSQIQGYNQQSTTKSMSSGTISAGGWKSLGYHTFVVSNTENPTNIVVSGTQKSSDFSPSSSSANGNMDLTVLHQAPEFTYSIQEINSELTEVANDKWILGLSKKKFTITTTTYDGASITKYSLYQNEIKIDEKTTNILEIDTKNIQLSQDSILQIIIEDSLGGKAIQSISLTNATVYFKPNFINTATTAKRNGQTSGKVNLNGLGQFFNGTIGNKTNTLSIKYKYWEKGTTEPTTYQTITTFDINNNEFEISDFELGQDFDFNKAYNVALVVTDTFTATNIDIIKSVPLGLAVWTEHKDRVDFINITKNNHELLAPYILFDEETVSTFELNDSAEKYKRIDIYFRCYINEASGLGGNSSISVYEPNGKPFEIEGNYDNGTYLYICNATYTINGNVVMKNRELRWRLGTSGATRTDITNNDSNLYIYKVVAYK